MCLFGSLLLSLIGCRAGADSAAHLGERPKAQVLIGQNPFETQRDVRCPFRPSMVDGACSCIPSLPRCSSSRVPRLAHFVEAAAIPATEPVWAIKFPPGNTNSPFLDSVATETS